MPRSAHFISESVEQNMKKIWNLPIVEYIPLQEIEETADAALVYTKGALDAVEKRLPFTPSTQVEISLAEEDHWKQAELRIHGDVIYSAGGGLAVDAAKYIAHRSGKPLKCIPTAMSVDAFFTGASGYRQNGCVKYMATKPPDVTLIDLDLIAQAPEPIKAAGICDVLSIATGSWDWKYARDNGRLDRETRFIPFVYDNAASILRGALDCAEAAGRGDREGMKQLIDCLALEVQLCNQIGHSRPEEGSEHYFAYSVENVMGKGLPHGDLVGPGILIMAQLQELDIGPLEKALRSCNIPLHSIPDNIIQQTLYRLPDYCNKHKFPFGIAHTLNAQ